ncbi:MAG: arginine deiminase-related protein, partial [Sediminibacterium sp.]
MQHSNHLLMIKPVRFDFNAETAVNNSFQTNVQDTLAQEKAAAEFTQFISVLRSHGIDVTVVEDTPDPHTPDSIFPNNWISFHTNGTVCLYPMYAKNRRLERKPTVLKAIEEKFIIQKTIDFTYYEQDDIFLEGTGSMVLDRENKIAYACLSPRTHEKVLSDFCTQLGYSPVVFWALDAEGQP